MALTKKITNESGITTNYHRVSSATLSEGRLTCFVDSYVSKDYREVEKSADSIMFDFNITLEEEESMGIRALCYNKIKSLEEWAKAKDC